jgi:6-phosphogluconate dehydrogenase
LSALKDERVKASKSLSGPTPPRGNNLDIDAQILCDDVGKALYASKIISYTQGFMLMREAAKSFKWDLNYGAIALMWRGGCIIRRCFLLAEYCDKLTNYCRDSAFLGDITQAFQKNPNLSSLLFDTFFAKAIEKNQSGWRRVVATSALWGIPVPAISTALAFYDGYRCDRLPANLLQAQRDFFGAHTYELLTEPGKFIHTNWTGRGGEVASTTYDA